MSLVSRLMLVCCVSALVAACAADPNDPLEASSEAVITCEAAPTCYALTSLSGGQCHTIVPRSDAAEPTCGSSGYLVDNYVNGTDACLAFAGNFTLPTCPTHGTSVIVQPGHDRCAVLSVDLGLQPLCDVGFSWDATSWVCRSLAPACGGGGGGGAGGGDGSGGAGPSNIKLSCKMNACCPLNNSCNCHDYGFGMPDPDRACAYPDTKKSTFGP